MSTQFEKVFQHDILLCVRKQNVCRSHRSTRIFQEGSASERTF